ncbi:MAG: HIT domain-containing protein [Candidatus Polarisedimenticolaceae bacterium]|nr:HIT domain-containing protein [Candidatus Polarisedimenticolaceae bacterium]
MTHIHPQLLEDCIVLGRFPLSHLLLSKDANYPWFILVPDRDGISEIYQLSEGDQQQLIRESSRLSRLLADCFKADKMNIAALGNVVPQLHIHHVVRYRDDAVWPGPMWGAVPAKKYSDTALRQLLEQVKGLLSEVDGFRAALLILDETD